MADDDEDGWRKQQHDDFGALGARVAATEGGIRELGRRFDNLGASFNEVAKDLSNKIERFGAAAVARPTNWTAFYGAGAALGVFCLALGAAVITPINNEIGRNSYHIDKTLDALSQVKDKSVEKDDFRDSMKQMAALTTAIIARLRTDEDSTNAEFREISTLVGRLDERTKTEHDSYLVTMERLQAQVDRIDANLVKRPELSASNNSYTERLNALSARENDTQAQLQGLFPAQEIIKELWSSLRELRGFHDPVK